MAKTRYSLSGNRFTKDYRNEIPGKKLVTLKETVKEQETTDRLLQECNNSFIHWIWSDFVTRFKHKR